MSFTVRERTEGLTLLPLFLCNVHALGGGEEGEVCVSMFVCVCVCICMCAVFEREGGRKKRKKMCVFVCVRARACVYVSVCICIYLFILQPILVQWLFFWQHSLVVTVASPLSFNNNNKFEHSDWRFYLSNGLHHRRFQHVRVYVGPFLLFFIYRQREFVLLDKRHTYIKVLNKRDLCRLR